MASDSDSDVVEIIRENTSAAKREEKEIVFPKQEIWNVDEEEDNDSSNVHNSFSSQPESESDFSQTQQTIGSQIRRDGSRVRIVVDYDPKLAEQEEEKRQAELQMQMKQARVGSAYENCAAIACQLRKEATKLMRQQRPTGLVYNYLTEYFVQLEKKKQLPPRPPFVQVKWKSMRPIRFSLKEYHEVLLQHYVNDLETGRIQCMLFEKAFFPNKQRNNDDPEAPISQRFIRLHVKLNYGSFERLPTRIEREKHMRIMWKLAAECYPYQITQPDCCAWIATTNPKLKHVNNGEPYSKLPMLRFVLHVVWPSVVCSSAQELYTFWATLNVRICAKDPFFSNCVDFSALNLNTNTVTLRNVFAYKVTLCPECKVPPNGVQPAPLADYESSCEDYNSDDEQRQLQRWNIHNNHSRICVRGCDKGKIVDESTTIKPLARVIHNPAWVKKKSRFSAPTEKDSVSIKQEQNNDHREEKEEDEEEENDDVNDVDLLLFQTGSDLIGVYTNYDIVSAMSIVVTHEQYIKYSQQKHHDFVEPCDAPCLDDKQYPNVASRAYDVSNNGSGEKSLKILYSQEIRIMKDLKKGKLKEYLHPHDRPELFLFCTKIIRKTGDGKRYKHLSAAQICIDHSSHIMFVNVTGKNSRSCFLNNHTDCPIYFLFRPERNIVLTQCTADVCREVLKRQAAIDNYEFQKQHRSSSRKKMLIKPTEFPTEEDTHILNNYMRFHISVESDLRATLWNAVGLTYSGPRRQIFELPEEKQPCDENGISTKNCYERIVFDKQTDGIFKR